MLAVIPVRGGELPLGADEAVAEAGGRAVFLGEDPATAAEASAALVEGRCVTAGAYAPAAWAEMLVPVLVDEDVVVLPSSPDGRDLAPRLAVALGRPLHAGAMSVRADQVVLARHGGLVAETVVVDRPVVATLIPNVRGVEHVDGASTVEAIECAPVDAADPVVESVDPPDPATVDLAEARRIIAGGAGFGGPEWFDMLAEVAPELDASFGATRVASDVGWAPHERYIGTTGVMVDPDLYIALAISGAVQHVTGLGQPEHIIAVNTDASAPMMAMADLAIVSDAKEVLTELASRVGLNAKHAMEAKRALERQAE